MLHNTEKTKNDFVRIDGEFTPVILNYNRILESNTNLGLISGYIKPFYDAVQKSKEYFEPLYGIQLQDPNIQSLVTMFLNMYRGDIVRMSKDDMKSILNKLINAYKTNVILNGNLGTRPDSKIVNQIEAFMGSENNTNVIKRLANLKAVYNHITDAIKTTSPQQYLKGLINSGTVLPSEAKLTQQAVESVARIYPVLMHNEFFHKLAFLFAEKETEYDHVILHAEKMPTSRANQYTLEWEELINSNNASVQKLFKNLALIDIIQNGLNSSLTDIYKYVPEVLHREIAASTLGVYTPTNIELQKFLIEFWSDNRNNNKLVPRDKKLVDRTNEDKLPMYLEEEPLTKEQKEAKKLGIPVERISHLLLDKFNKMDRFLPVKREKNFKHGRLMTDIARGTDPSLEYTTIFYIPAAVKKPFSQIPSTVSNSETTEGIPYTDYTALEGENVLTEEEWNTLTEKQKQNQLDCKTAGKTKRFKPNKS